MNELSCEKCGNKINIDKALSGQIEARVIAAEHQKHELEMKRVREEAEAKFNEDKKRLEAMATRQVQGQKELIAQQMKQEMELEREKLKLQLEGEVRKKTTEQERLLQTLKDDAEASKLENKELRDQLKELMDTLREEKKARQNAELEAQKKLAEEEDKIRLETSKLADEKYRLKMLENEKRIADMQKSLDDAQRKATQGSQQNQGEVLELDLENALRSEFIYDEITEVKKGQRGADIVQTVKNAQLKTCGMLLWETKNGKWQPAWVAKFKQDIREANANVGVIVSHEMPPEYGDMKHIEGNVWAVKPRLAPVIATALRATIIQVHAAHKNAEGRDEKMNALYTFLTGPEFRHRVEAIVENYGTLQAEIEKEKRSAALRWAHQEKAIRAVIDNTIGMYGDLQGITSRALPRIESLEIEG